MVIIQNINYLHVNIIYYALCTDTLVGSAYKQRRKNARIKLLPSSLSVTVLP